MVIVPLVMVLTAIFGALLLVLACTVRIPRAARHDAVELYEQCVRALTWDDHEWLVARGWEPGTPLLARR